MKALVFGTTGINSDEDCTPDIQAYLTSQHPNAGSTALKQLGLLPIIPISQSSAVPRAGEISAGLNRA